MKTNQLESKVVRTLTKTNKTKTPEFCCIPITFTNLDKFISNILITFIKQHLTCQWLYSDYVIF